MGLYCMSNNLHRDVEEIHKNTIPKLETYVGKIKLENAWNDDISLKSAVWNNTKANISIKNVRLT